MTEKLLMDTFITECGHRLQVWSEELAGGGWELHAHAECELCEGIILEIASEVFPTVEVKHGD